MPLEKMNEFFDSRLAIYDEHQLNCIEGAAAFLTYTASLLPMQGGCRVLDLGCGTGLELERYYRLNPTAAVTGIDLAEGMLGRLREKLPTQPLTLICGSYFEVPFGEDCFDAAVSVESLHHFTYAEKLPLYTRLCKALKPGCAFILTDYFADTDAREQTFRAEYERLRKEQHLPDGEFYHYDTPLTLAHEIACLREAGFSQADALKSWGATYTVRAVR